MPEDPKEDASIPVTTRMPRPLRDKPLSQAQPHRSEAARNQVLTRRSNRQLGISPRTIEVHRARIMDKLGAKNAADLVRIVLS